MRTSHLLFVSAIVSQITESIALNEFSTRKHNGEVQTHNQEDHAIFTLGSAALIIVSICFFVQISKWLSERQEMQGYQRMRANQVEVDESSFFAQGSVGSLPDTDSARSSGLEEEMRTISHASTLREASTAATVPRNSAGPYVIGSVDTEAVSPLRPASTAPTVLRNPFRASTEQSGGDAMLAPPLTRDSSTFTAVRRFFARITNPRLTNGVDRLALQTPEEMTTMPVNSDLPDGGSPDLDAPVNALSADTIRLGQAAEARAFSLEHHLLQSPNSPEVGIRERLVLHNEPLIVSDVLTSPGSYVQNPGGEPVLEGCAKTK